MNIRITGPSLSLSVSHLNLERPLESAGKEAPEWPDDAGEDGHEDGVDEEGVDGHRRLHPQLREKVQVSSEVDFFKMCAHI